MDGPGQKRVSSPISTGGEGGFFAGVVDGVLLDEDGGGGFEGDAEEDVLTI